MGCLLKAINGSAIREKFPFIFIFSFCQKLVDRLLRYLCAISVVLLWLIVLILPFRWSVSLLFLVLVLLLVFLLLSSILLLLSLSSPHQSMASRQTHMVQHSQI